MTEGATGLWAANEGMEASARIVLSPLLDSLEPLACDAYEAAVEAPAIPSKGTAARDREAAVFLRRALVDFRATWTLLRSGYASPAAAVAASLWEHSLTVVALLSKEGSDRSVPPSGDAPWSPLELAEFLRETPYDARPKNAYAAYKWLCKIKHPTLRSGVHDSGASRAEDGSFVVMSVPDTRPEDAPAKRIIILLTLARLTAATEAFVEAREPERSSPEYQRFRRRLNRVQSEAAAHMGSAPLPFRVLPDEMPKHFR
jgi:hypothetical protein